MCDLTKTVWKCKNCRFTTTKEGDARVHGIRHQVYPYQQIAFRKRKVKVVGVCFRCGEQFFDRDSWAMHEFLMDVTHATEVRKFARTLAKPDLEAIDRRGNFESRRGETSMMPVMGKE